MAIRSCAGWKSHLGPSAEGGTKGELAALRVWALTSLAMLDIWRSQSCKTLPVNRVRRRARRRGGEIHQSREGEQLE